MHFTCLTHDLCNTLRSYLRDNNQELCLLIVFTLCSSQSCAIGLYDESHTKTGLQIRRAHSQNLELGPRFVSSPSTNISPAPAFTCPRSTCPSKEKKRKEKKRKEKKRKEKERKGKARKGKERKGKERKGKERKEKKRKEKKRLRC